MAIFKTQSSFTRPADTTAYAANDLVANSTTAGSVTPMSFNLPPFSMITWASLKKSTATATNANFTLHLFNSSPTVANGDNSAFSPTNSNYLGSLQLDSTTSLFSDAAGSVNRLTSNGIPCGGTVYGLLLAGAAYTPASAEVFTITLAGITNT